MAVKLKGLFVLFAGYIVKNCATLLDATNISKTGKHRVLILPILLSLSLSLSLLLALSLVIVIGLSGVQFREQSGE